MIDLIIVGGGPAGLAAAIYARRAGKAVLVFEGAAIGGQISRAHRVENYPGFSEIGGMELSEALAAQATALGAEIVAAQVAAADLGGAVKRVRTADGTTFEARAVVLATGVVNRTLGVAREDELLGAGVSYCAVCDGAFFKGLDVAVVGGGNTALEDAVYLSERCKTVYLVHRRDAFRAESALVAALAKRPNIVPVLPATVVRLEGEGELTGVVVGTPDGERRLDVAGLFVCIGKVPSNALFARWCDLTEDGYFASGEDCRTRTPGVFVAGDCRAKSVRQLTTAIADGAVAALAACSYLNL